ncbi:sensor histidine kinase [Streptomyces humidus]|uniref:sensor histidine kinase n=1 Tax=Streptomyces humidus TaxID=52259 RepID=UPI00332D4D38
MTANGWTRRLSREAPSPKEVSRPGRLLAWAVRLLVPAALMCTAFHDSRVHGWIAVAGAGAALASGGLAGALLRTTPEHRLRPSLALVLMLLGLAAGSEAAGFRPAAVVLCCGCAVTALERLPLLAALPAASVAFAAFVAVDDGTGPTSASAIGGMALAGYALRLDAEARGNAHRLLAQERAARAAEAESAALAERARVAREIHDVLAHSLSAQLVHLEAARLLLERRADRAQILARVVAARGMARDGLDETRQSLSALRGELTPLEDCLRALVRTSDGVEVTVGGERRPLPAEASQAVRRVAREALTNARRHAPGAKIRVRLEYGPREVTLDVRDTGGPPGELAEAGGGYGLLGMRERAELLGGSLAAGPGEEGFVVTLKVPV